MPLNIPVVPLSAVVGIHFVLTSWAFIHPFLTALYYFTNIFVLIIGLWALKDQVSGEPVQFFLFGMAFTILNDIILLGIRFGPFNRNPTSDFQFSAAMAIINLLLKPITCLVLFKNWQDRGNPQYDDFQNGPPPTGYTAPPGGFNAPPGGEYMPPPGGYIPQERKGFRQPHPQTTYTAPTVGP